jgi:CheY-like chemotaxis protein
LPSLRGVRALVIDDQEVTRDLVTAVLRHAGAEVHAADSVREGLERFGATSPHVVICDLAMPEEDGFAFLGAVRELTTPSKATAVIALTAFGRPEDRQHALAAGFDGYLKKPVDPEELAWTVLRLSKLKQSPDTIP